MRSDALQLGRTPANQRADGPEQMGWFGGVGEAVLQANRGR